MGWRSSVYLTEDICGVLCPQEVWSVSSQSQHAFSLDILLQSFLVLSLQELGRNEIMSICLFISHLNIHTNKHSCGLQTQKQQTNFFSFLDEKKLDDINIKAVKEK